MMVSPKVVQERGPELERNAKGAGTGPFEFVEWVKDDHILLKRNDNYWNKQGGPVPRPDPLPPDPRRHRQAGEPPVGRDRRDGLRPAARRGGGQGRQERGRGRRAVARRSSPTSSTTPSRRSTTRPCARPWPTRSTSTRSSRGSGSTSACRRTGRSRPRAGRTTAASPPSKRDLAKVKAKLAEGGQPNGFTFSAHDEQHPDQRPGSGGDAGTARRGRHHDEDQARRRRHRSWRTATARTSR